MTSPIPEGPFFVCLILPFGPIVAVLGAAGLFLGATLGEGLFPGAPGVPPIVGFFGALETGLPKGALSFAKSPSFG